jgi:hypothetical protein
MPLTSRPDALTGARVTAAFSAVAFLGAGISWGSLATMRMWASEEFRLHAEWRDLIPGAIALWMLLIAFQFARGAIAPGELPLGVGKRALPVPVGQFGLHLVTAALLGFMGFVLLSAAGTYADYVIHDLEGRPSGFDDPMWDWMRPVQRYSGVALILVACLALVRRTRQFLAGRNSE